MRRAVQRLRGMAWQTKLLLCLLGVGVLPAVLICVLNYGVASHLLLAQRMENTSYLLEQDVAAVNAVFSTCEQLSDNLAMDEDLRALLESTPPASDSAFLEMDGQVNRIIGRYFSSDTVHSCVFYTEACGFGSNDIPILNQNFESTELYRQAVAAAGRTVWVPTYRFDEEFPVPQLDNTSASYKTLFSMVKQLNLMGASSRAPVLVVNFSDSMLGTMLARYKDMGGDCAVYTPSGKIVYSTGGMSGYMDELLARPDDAVYTTGSGSAQRIVCTSSLDVNHWKVSVALPTDVVLREFRLFRRLTVAVAALLFLAALALSAFLRRSLSRPLHDLADGLRHSGEGDFDARVCIASHDEFGDLALRFNEMNEKISKLISENYLQKISNQQAEIMALSFQLNPHFLYNCLNLINLMALAGETDNVSRMIVALSKIMRYTAKTYDELVLFSEDLTWLEQYMFLVGCLNENIEFQTDFDPALMRQRVPKMLLQPFVENSVVHGLSGGSGRGTIAVAGRYDAERHILTFTVSDNGAGMTAEECASVIHAESGCIHNVLRRIRLIYGDSSSVHMDSSPGKGTVTTITFPARAEDL